MSGIYLWGFVIGFACSSVVAYMPNPYKYIVLVLLIVIGAFVVRQVAKSQ